MSELTKRQTVLTIRMLRERKKNIDKKAIAEEKKKYRDINSYCVENVYRCREKLRR